MRIRILTLNVLNLEGDPRRQEVINAELRRLDPDLVSFQEVIKDDGRDQLATLLAGTDLHGTQQADVMAYTLPYVERYGGCALATRWPHRILETYDPRENADHLHPWTTLAAVVDIPGQGELLFIATTLTARFDGGPAHEREVVALSQLDARHRRKLPTVIAGDFNARPDSAAIRYMTGLQSLEHQGAHYHDAWEVAGDGPGYTWSVDNPLAGSLHDLIVRQPGLRWRIDYVFVGSVTAHPFAECRIEAAALAFDEPIDGLWPSDHFGVLVDVELGLVDIEGLAEQYPGSGLDV